MFLLKCIKSKASVQNEEPFRWIGFFEVAFPWHDINFLWGPFDFLTFRSGGQFLQVSTKKKTVYFKLFKSFDPSKLSRGF